MNSQVLKGSECNHQSQSETHLIEICFDINLNNVTTKL